MQKLFKHNSSCVILDLYSIVDDDENILGCEALSVGN